VNLAPRTSTSMRCRVWRWASLGDRRARISANGSSLSLLFNRDGDCLAAKLRPGNVHSADGWEELLLPEIERQQERGKEVVFRGDAAFAQPELYEALEERDVKYAIRLPANDNLQGNIREMTQATIRSGLSNAAPKAWPSEYPSSPPS
jgi:Transposase DDE domain group 1